MPKAASESQHLGFTLGELAAALNAELVGNAAQRVRQLAPLDEAGADAVAFLANPRYRSQLASTQAGCVIVAPREREAAAARGAALVVADPYRSFAALTRWWAAQTRVPVAPGIHPSACIDPSAVVAADAAVGAFACVEAAAVIESGAVIGAHCVIGPGASVGVATRLAARVTLGAGCHIGARGIVHSGVVIGADGFGFAPAEGRWEKIEQLGGVRIGDDCEIGANPCIDRGALGDTVLADGVKLDNLIQVGHNVRIGAHTAIAGCAGIAGSAVIGSGCTIGGGAIVLGHLSLADGVHISAASVVTRSLRTPGHYSGVFPIDDNAAWEKNAATLRHLHALRHRVRQLEASLQPDAIEPKQP